MTPGGAGHEPAPSRLDDFIRARRDDIISDWMQRMRELSPVRDLSRAAIVNHLPQILERIPATGPSRFLISFSGRVLDYVTQTPLSSRLVTYRRSGTGGDAPTDANGGYTLTVPGTGLYEVRIDGVSTGGTHVNGTAHRGDFFIDTATSCISRYGVTLDSESLRPVTGAVVTLWGRSVTTNAEGWYRIDLGCARSALSGGTTIIVARHSEYQNARAIVGRGVAGVQRVDLSMERR